MKKRTEKVLLRNYDLSASVIADVFVKPVGFIPDVNSKCSCGRIMIGREGDAYIAGCGCGRTVSRCTYNTPLDALIGYIRESNNRKYHLYKEEYTDHLYKADEDAIWT